VGQVTTDERRRRESRIALDLGLPWGWRVRVVGGRLLATGREPLQCGHQTISTIVRDDGLLSATARLARGVHFHLSGG